ncbi:hypothetical protein BG005_002728 [Podila minutissima]|nr:hypothetical protein BG005_002728 [Podila minutissima]
MGRPTGRNLEDELMTKIKLMFDRFHESDQKDNRAFILRPPPPGTSMESMSSLDDSGAQPYMSFADIFGPNQSTQFESDILQRQRSQELRQQQLRQLYVQEFLARSTRRRRQAQGIPELPQNDTDSRANTQPSPQARYQAHDGLLISSTQPSIADRVQEFRDSAQRARAAMRNSLNSDLVIEEDAQVLLTGEVSRRRRRPFMGTETTGTTGTATTETAGTVETAGTIGTELVSGSNVEGAASGASDTVETSIQAQGQGAQASGEVLEQADIEAVVRQLEATASTSSSRPAFGSRLNQILESDQVDQTHVHVSTPPPLLQAQPLPSPPTADQDVGDGSPH